MRAVVVVVRDMGPKNRLQMAAPHDEIAIKTFAAQCSDETLREGVGHGSPDRSAEDLGAFGSQHFVEPISELSFLGRGSGSGTGKWPSGRQGCGLAGSPRTRRGWT
jgi:hypothetical protein